MEQNMIEYDHILSKHPGFAKQTRKDEIKFKINDTAQWLMFQHWVINYIIH